MGDILHKALQVDARIAAQYASVEGLRAVFQEVASPRARLRLQAAHLSTRTGLPGTDGREVGEEESASRTPGGLVRQRRNPGLCCLEPQEWAGGVFQLWVAGGRNSTSGNANSRDVQLTFSFRCGRSPTSGWPMSRRFTKVPGSRCRVHPTLELTPVLAGIGKQ